MTHVTALAQHILTLEPEKDAARLCLYNFLKNLCEPTEPINAELLNRFYWRALSFNHWQANKAGLFGEVTAILQHYSDTHRVALPLVGVLTPEELQVVPAERLRTMELVINRHLEKSSSPFDQWRAFPEGEDRIIAITLQGDRSLRVTVYPKVLAIREGELIPLCQDLTLLYTPDLQLHPMMTHQLDVGPHAAARFRVAPDGVHGTVVRGYTFQKYAAMDGGPLHRYPVLFYPLKRLEQFFVNRKSDPMYIELTSLLEKAIELVTGENPESIKFATAALERGRLALEHIFPDDKLVRLLINNLEKSLVLETGRLNPGLQANSVASSEIAAPSPNQMGSDAPEEADGIDLVEAMALKGRVINSRAGAAGISPAGKAPSANASPAGSAQRRNPAASERAANDTAANGSATNDSANRKELSWERIRPLDL